MTAPHDLDRQLIAFLKEGPTELPDPSFDAVRDRTEQTQQRVVLGPWRVPEMNKFLAVGLGAAAVVVVLLIGSNLLGSSSPPPGGEPPASVAPSEAEPSSEPSASVDVGLAEGPFVVDYPVTGSRSVTAGSSGMQITVTIPASGWTFNPAFSALGKGDDADPPEASILLWADPPRTGFYVYGDPCQWASTTSDTPVTTVDEIVAALAAQASRDASEPTDVTVGGYAGKSLTLHVPDDAVFADCDEGQFGTWGLERDQPARYQEGPGQIDEIWFLDVDGFIVILDATYRPDSSAELVEELRAIAESATFELP